MTNRDTMGYIEGMEPKTDWIKARVTPKEKKRVEKAAAKEGRSVANYIRYLLRNILK